MTAGLNGVDNGQKRAAVVADFAGSELFDRTFQEGMALVEETAAYLEGEGRRDSKLLSRAGALAYAGESMRLTTRLMQIASWLLVQRAVREGDLSPNEATQDRYRLTGSTNRAETMEGADELPEGLNELADRAQRLYERIAYMDRRMYLDEEAASPTTGNPVLSQMALLQQAFGA